LVPDGLGQLGASRVLGADEDDPSCPQARSRFQPGKSGTHQLDVPLPPVALRRHTHDDPEILQHSEVMRHEIAPEAHQFRQLGRRPVGEGQGIDHREAVRVAQSGVEAGPRI